jgi:hypothetical protein
MYDNGANLVIIIQSATFVLQDLCEKITLFTAKKAVTIKCNCLFFALPLGLEPRTL